MPNRNLGDTFAEGIAPTAGKPNLYNATGWVVYFDADTLPAAESYEVWHGAARGPGGIFLVYIDTKFFDVGENGLINRYEPTQPMFLRKGQIPSFHWSINTGTAPKVWLYFREPEVGRI